MHKLFYEPGFAVVDELESGVEVVVSGVSTSASRGVYLVTSIGAMRSLMTQQSLSRGIRTAEKQLIKEEIVSQALS